MLSIFTEFISDRRQSLSPIISGVPHRTVLGPLPFILYTSEMFELAENRLFAYADQSIWTKGITCIANSNKN